MSKFAMRWIRPGGWVKIKGKKYFVDQKHMKYDGRLDNMMFAFCLYPGNEDIISLWGTASDFYAYNDEVRDILWKMKPECVDGKFVWECWRLEPTETNRKEDTNGK